MLGERSACFNQLAMLFSEVMASVRGKQLWRVQERGVYIREPATLPGTDNQIAKRRRRKFLA